MSNKKYLELSRNMTLDQAFVEAGCTVGDELEIFGGRKFTLTAGRPRVSYLRLTQCKLSVGVGAFYVGHPALNTVVDLDGCIVEGSGSDTATHDVFSGVTLNCVDGCIWGKTLNGPVNALGVYQTVIDDIKSDALSGVRNATDVRIEGIKGGGNTHPDMHQLFLPNLDAPAKVSLSTIRGWNINGQGIHWTVSNGKPLSISLNGFYVPWRLPGQVWQSRITVPIQDFIARGCTFGQPLNFAPSEVLGQVAFIDCDFDSLVVENDEQRKILDGCKFIRCTVHTPANTYGTHVPADVIVV